MSIAKKCAEKVMNNFATFSDVTLIAGQDREKFPVPRRIFVQSSRYFGRLLGPNSPAETDKEATVENIDGPTLKAIIQFIYIGHIDLNESNIASILAAAVDVELVPLQQECCEYLQKKLSVESCAKTLTLAVKYSFGQLITNALTLMAANFEKIPPAEIVQLDGNIFGDILKQDRIQTPETNIFDCLVKWLRTNQTDRAKFMPDLLKAIRLEHMPGEFLRSIAKPIFEEHGLGQLVRNDYARRILEFQPNSLQRCPQTNHKSIYYAEFHLPSTIKIFKYTTSQWNEFKTIAHNSSRYDFGWAFCGNKLYVLGGYLSQKTGAAKVGGVMSYEMGTWTQQTLPSMLTARMRFNPVVFDKHIYVFGGRNHTGALNECERFNIETNKWEALPPMPHKLYNCSTIEINGKFYVAGGYAAPGLLSKLIMCYNPKLSKAHWRGVMTLNASHEITVLTKSHDLLYVFVKNSARLHVLTYNTVTQIFNDQIIPFSRPAVSQIVEFSGRLHAFYNESGKTKFGRILLCEESVNLNALADVTRKSEDNIHPRFPFVY